MVTTLRKLLGVLVCTAVAGSALAGQADSLERRVMDGLLRGALSEDGAVLSFKGVPYAAPPLGELRWKPPQPVVPWQGPLLATEFAPRAMQKPIYDDMFFRDSGPSEDCLYLNVWLPADAKVSDALPVMCWIHGGALLAGGTSEPRQDGGQLAKKGVIVVSVGYRLGVFGFLAHPELAEESPDLASGNYGFLDIVAGLKWVQENIGAFGGDPGNVTIFGESAGSEAVSALMASPLADGLFHKAIAQSGSLLGPWFEVPSRSAAEQKGLAFASDLLGTHSIAELRRLPASKLLDTHWERALYDFDVCLDGHFLPRDPAEVFAAGDQSKVPLIAGWNADESSAEAFLGQAEPTYENLKAAGQRVFGERTEAFLSAYGVKGDEDARRAAADFASDEFTGHEMWRLVEAQVRGSGAPVYRYRFDQKLPLPLDAPTGTLPRAAHAWEIEYVFNVLESKPLPWRESDQAVANLMSSYWVQFAKNGNPNGSDLPIWPAYAPEENRPVLHISAEPEVRYDTDRMRYEFLEAFKLNRFSAPSK